MEAEKTQQDQHQQMQNKGQYRGNFRGRGGRGGYQKKNYTNQKFYNNKNENQEEYK